MRRNQKKRLLDCVDSLHEVHKKIKEALQKKEYAATQNMLADCQGLAIAIGENIEQLEGAGHVAVSFAEAYCEALFCAYEEIRCVQEVGKSDCSGNHINENRVCKILNRQLVKIENSVKNDITVRLEIAFFPYKASMWDSLESVYLAAKEDPECDAYCVPIPYYDLNPDHSFGQMHYEGGDYPNNIEVTDWQAYNFEERKPDVIFIHNPYDNCNYVTCVHPRFYSANLKKYAGKLAYIPYYTTFGRMSEAQSLLPAYLYADYIVIQSPQFREYFDKSIPDGKFLPFGSPKFDRVINKCENPPEPPEEWLSKMMRKDVGNVGQERVRQGMEKQGDRHAVRKRIIFYNTSLFAMLKDTEVFLKKMEYVFRCFEGRKDVCLLWRPHPLLESTFDSMRPQFRPAFDALKQRFLEEDLGIYDTTPDIEESIAMSDAYIGDEGTSVTSLFGVAGKPIFILNNQILEEPGVDDWRKEAIVALYPGEKDCFAFAQGNRLYISEPYKYDYKYFCNLPENVHGGNHYLIQEINGKRYVCNLFHQDIFVLGKHGIEERIELAKKIERGKAFVGGWKYDKYLILLPADYPAIVRYDTVARKIDYFDKNIDIFITEKENRKMAGGTIFRQGSMYVASLTDNRIYKMHIESGKTEVIELPIENRCGFSALVEHKDDIWGIPFDGRVITRWNPDSGEVREYVLETPEEFTCIHPLQGYRCEITPFNIPAFYEEYMYLPPCWSNMYLKLNTKTGKVSQWEPAYVNKDKQNGSFAIEKSTFLLDDERKKVSELKLFSYTRNKLYSIDLETEVCKEIVIRFDIEELKRHERGFTEYSDGMKYMCVENSFNSLTHFLDGNMTGESFDRERQLAVCAKTVSNSSGRCGEQVYMFIKTKLSDSR